MGELGAVHRNSSQKYFFPESGWAGSGPLAECCFDCLMPCRSSDFAREDWLRFSQEKDSSGYQETSQVPSSSTPDLARASASSLQCILQWPGTRISEIDLGHVWSLSIMRPCITLVFVHKDSVTWRAGWHWLWKNNGWIMMRVCSRIYDFFNCNKFWREHRCMVRQPIS